MPSGYVTVTSTCDVPGVVPSGNCVGSSTVIVGCSSSAGYPGTVTDPVTSSEVVASPYGFSTPGDVGS